MAWLESLPDNLQDSATAEALRRSASSTSANFQAIVPAARVRPKIEYQPRPPSGGGFLLTPSRKSANGPTDHRRSS